MRGYLKILGILSLFILISACGGGGGGNAATSALQCTINADCASQGSTYVCQNNICVDIGNQPGIICSADSDCSGSDKCIGNICTSIADISSFVSNRQTCEYYGYSSTVASGVCTDGTSNSNLSDIKNNVSSQKAGGAFMLSLIHI